MLNKTIVAYRKYAKVAIKNWSRSKKSKKKTPNVSFFQLTTSLTNEYHPAQRKNVLDIGCGPGIDSILFARNGYYVLGVDVVPEFLHHARKMRHKYGLNRYLTFLNCDFSKIRSGNKAIGTRRFHLIWANASLLHLNKQNLPRVLRQLKQLVVPQGVFSATFYHGSGEGIYSGSFVPGRFFARYHKNELRAMLERCGWQVAYIKTVSNEVRAGRWLTVIATS